MHGCSSNCGDRHPMTTCLQQTVPNKSEKQHKCDFESLILHLFFNDVI